MQAISNQEEARAAGGRSPHGTAAAAAAAPPAQGLPGSRQVVPKPQQQLTGSRDYRDLGNALPAAVSTLILQFAASCLPCCGTAAPSPLLHSGVKVCSSRRGCCISMRMVQAYWMPNPTCLPACFIMQRGAPQQSKRHDRLVGVSGAAGAQQQRQHPAPRPGGKQQSLPEFMQQHPVSLPTCAFCSKEAATDKELKPARVGALGQLPASALSRWPAAGTLACPGQVRPVCKRCSTPASLQCSQKLLKIVLLSAPSAPKPCSWAPPFPPAPRLCRLWRMVPWFRSASIAWW